MDKEEGIRMVGIRCGVFSKHMWVFLGYSSAGFLAYISRDVETDYTPVAFDTEVYDYDNNYNPATGVYLVPYDGLYLINAVVSGEDYNAGHSILLDGITATLTYELDPGYPYQSTSTSIVLHLESGQEVTVKSGFTGTVSGSAYYIKSSFGATLLYPD